LSFHAIAAMMPSTIFSLSLPLMPPCFRLSFSLQPFSIIAASWLSFDVYAILADITPLSLLQLSPLRSLMIAMPLRHYFSAILIHYTPLFAILLRCHI
jgi:hypothetical protein